MDPIALIAELQHLIESGQYGQAVFGIGAYYQWRLKGGNEPTNGDKAVDLITTVLADKIDNLN